MSNKKDFNQYKELLLQLKTQILNNGILTKIDDLAVSTDDLADEGDLASNVVNQQISFSMRQRELEKLRAIEEALMRIDEGTYGHCDECEEPIGEKRLENQPWATLCITHAEEYERENQKFHKAG